MLFMWVYWGETTMSRRWTKIKVHLKHLSQQCTGQSSAVGLTACH